VATRQDGPPPNCAGRTTSSPLSARPMTTNSALRHDPTPHLELRASTAHTLRGSPFTARLTETIDAYVGLSTCDICRVHAWPTRALRHFTRSCGDRLSGDCRSLSAIGGERRAVTDSNVPSVRPSSSADAARGRETSVRHAGSASIRPSSMRPKLQCGCVRHSGGETFADSCGHTTSYRHPSGIRPSIQDAATRRLPSSQSGSDRASSSSPRGGVSVLAHFGYFRSTLPDSIHPFDKAEDRLFTATFASECRPMDLPGRQHVGLPCSTRRLRYTPCRPCSIHL
jgi:hypothetical protein